MIKDSKQILALASPVRLALVDTLEGTGPRSVAELATLMGMPPDGLYYHLRILEKRGLIRRLTDRDSGPQAILDVAARPLLLRYDTADKKNRHAVNRVVAAMLRGALRWFGAAFHGSVRVQGKRRELWAAQRTARLTAAQLEEINQLLNRLLDSFDPGGDNEKAKLYSLTFVLSPQGKGDDL